MRTYSFLAALFVLTPFAALADPDLPAPSAPGHWRYIATEDDLTTSRCVGAPSTPLCATETLLACFQRGQPDLCRQVDDGADEYASVFSTPAPEGHYLAYRIVSARRLAVPDDDAPTAEAGDVLLVLDQQEGVIGHKADASGAPWQRFLLRQGGNGAWKVVHWGGPGD